MSLKKLFASKLAFVFLLTSLGPLAPFASANKETSSCENGECINQLLTRLENLSSAYVKQCLPSEGMKGPEIEKYHQENGLSEQCWKMITEINHFEGELQKHQTRLEERLGCSGGECRFSNPGSGLNHQLGALTKVEQNLSCTEPKKQAIKKQCPADVGCALAAGALGITTLGMGGHLFEAFRPDKEVMKNCHLGDDSCAAQLALGFLKATVSFFKGSWDLLKLAGQKTGEAFSEFWEWVKGAEDHTANAQLALAKASEDPGVFEMLRNDFPGTIKKLFSALVAALKEWMKNDILCQKWEGVPHFSKCLRPTESFDCVSCKAMVNGLCAISGTVMSEVVPAFLTGGLVVAVKEGASGAAKIARLFTNVSAPTIAAVKNSQAARLAAEASTKIDDVLRLSRGLQVAKSGVEGALRAIKAYMLMPTRKLVKDSYSVLVKAAQAGNLYIAETKYTRLLLLSGGTFLKTTGKILIYPIDNPMTALAFKSGQRTFSSALKLGSARIAGTSGAASVLVRSHPSLEEHLVKLEQARMKSDGNHLQRAEEEFHKIIEPKRKTLIDEILSRPDADFEEVISLLYPELKYGELAKTLTAQKVLDAEKELWIAIEKMPEGATKETFVRKYQLHVAQGEARSRIFPESSLNYERILRNSRLSSDDRFTELLKIINRKPASPVEEKLMREAIEKAHLHGDHGVFEYSWRELREKYRLLREGGFSADEADALIRSGLAGRPPLRELLNPGDTLFSGFAEDILSKKYHEKRAELIKLLESQDPQKSSGFFRSLERLFGRGPKASSAPILDNLEALYFVDYPHANNELLEILINGKRVQTAKLPERYGEQAFENFKETRAWLLSERPELNKETLLKIHERMMKKSVADFGNPEDIGKIRPGSIWGNVPSQNPISQKIVQEIESNPYLSWSELGKSADSAWGQILYPNPYTVERKTLDLIREKSPQVVIDIEDYQKLPGKIKAQEELFNKMPSGSEKEKIREELKHLKERHATLATQEKKLTTQLVNALVDDLMDWFTRQRTLIGDLDSPKKLDEFVNLLADFQRKLVSIHPLIDGNGRSSREFLSYALMKEGFPPPRIIYPNADLYLSQEEWRKMIKHGILASDFLLDDMIERVKFGLPMENSVDLITPYTRPPVRITYKGEKKTPYMEGVEYIDPRFYREVVKRLLNEDAALKAQMSQNPVIAWDKIHKKIEETFSKNNIYYKHPKHGIERVSIGYVDEDFKLLFGKPSFHDRNLFDFKMKTWYDEEITWRGLASTTSIKTEPEIIRMFEQLSAHNASNAVLGKIRGSADPESIRSAALADFDKFNNDVFGEGLVKMAKDHSETGPLYGVSYGYSTSKSRDVGKAFAMGAMVVGEYGAHRAPELQALLKSRVLVGARRAHKDVDLGRLKQLRDEFSYKYGRQQEVMGIGASDPDAITIIQTLDAQGEVLLSYLRNKNNPREVFVVKGEADPDQLPDPSKVVKTIQLGLR